MLAGGKSRRPAEQAERACHLVAQPGLAADDERRREGFPAGVDEAVREGAVLFDRDEMPLAGRRPLIARRQLASILGIDRSTLYRNMKQYGLTAPRGLKQKPAGD